jgi:hypothetical protein
VSVDDLFTGAALAEAKQLGDVVNGRYWLPDPVSGRPRQFTRVTTFAKSVSDTYLLSLWQQRMAVKGVTMRPDLFARISSLPFEERAELNLMVEKAKEAAGSADRAHMGSALHSFTEAHDRDEKVASGAWDADLAAYRLLLQKAGLQPIPDLIERKVCNPMFDVVGTLDRSVLQVVDKPGPAGPVSTVQRILDLKTGRSLDWGWGEIAVQLYLYASADHLWNPVSEEWELFPAHDTGTALVIHLPAGEHRADLYEIDLSLGEEGAHLCKRVREWRAAGRVKRAVTIVESVTA